MASLNEIGGIAFNLLDPVPTEEKFYVTLEPVEYNEAVNTCLQNRKTHPDEALEIYPRENGKYTVIRCVKK